MIVLPKSWLNRTILSLRRGFFRMVAKVTYTGHKWFVQVDKQLKQVREIIRVREKIWLMTQAT